MTRSTPLPAGSARRAVHSLSCLALAALLLLGVAASAQAEKIKTSLLVPKTTGAAKMIYDQVVSGVTSHPDLDVKIIELNTDSTAEKIDQRIQRQGSELLIALGNKSYRLSAELSAPATVIAGGISGKPNGIPTLSLTGDPEPTLAQLKALAPDVTQLRLVYNDAVNGWWYRRVREAAPAYGITVVGYQAADLKEGVKLYEKLLADAEVGKTAVWIPLRSIVPSKTILPLLLDKAWSKKLAVISNNPSHTKLGSLIAVFPDHERMGRQLAEFAIAHHRDEESPQIIGTRALRTAINVRTSSHIGIRLSRKDLERYDRVFPAQR